MVFCLLIIPTRCKPDADVTLPEAGDTVPHCGPRTGSHLRFMGRIPAPEGEGNPDIVPIVSMPIAPLRYGLDLPDEPAARRRERIDAMLAAQMQPLIGARA